MMNKYAKFSGMAFQMLGTIALGVYAGVRLDRWLQNKFPIWTLVLSFVSIAGSMYVLIKQIPKE